MNKIRLMQEASRCLICEDAPCTAACKAGYSGTAVKPIAQRFILEIAQNSIMKGVQFSGIGGIYTWRDALLPGQNAEVEMKVAFDTMDPVFTPQITKLPDGFVTKAQSEIAERFGDINTPIASSFALLEHVIDITNSPTCTGACPRP